MGKIYGNTIGGVAPVNVFELELEDGTVLNGVVAEEPPVITARPKDIRIGKTAITVDGVIEGENTITYRTEMASYLILPGDNFSIPLNGYNMYDYTKMQCVIVVFDVEYSENVTTMGITVGDNVFSATTAQKLSTVTKNNNTGSIDLNMTNETENIYEIFYFTYHEDSED